MASGSSKWPAPALETGRDEAPEAAREGFGEVTATFPADRNSGRAGGCGLGPGAGSTRCGKSWLTEIFGAETDGFLVVKVHLDAAKLSRRC